MSFYAQFAAHYEQVFPFRPATMKFVTDRLGDHGRVLDLGCGPGHYTGALAGLGLEMVGVDLDPAMIDAARERYATASFVVSDLSDLATIADRADGAFCIGNVLPHLAPDHLDRFLTDLAGILPAKSPWIVQTVNFDRLLPLNRPHDFPPLTPAAGLVFQRRYESDQDGRVAFHTTLSRDGQVLFTGEATLWPQTSADLTARHADHGFELAEEVGGFTGEAFDARQSGGCVQVYRRAG